MSAIGTPLPNRIPSRAPRSFRRCPIALEGALGYVGSDGGNLPLTQIGRALRACNRINRSIRCRPHDMPVRQQVVPHPPSAVGSIAGKKAGAEPWRRAAAPTARSLQARHKTTPRDTERPAHPVHGPDPRCFAMKANFKSIPSAK